MKKNIYSLTLLEEKKMKYALTVTIMLALTINAFAGVADTASVYLPFEGAWNGDGVLTSPCWENQGTLAPGETPWLVGNRAPAVGQTTVPYARVTNAAPDSGVKGQALDASQFTEYQAANTYYWGAKGSSTTPLEVGMSNSKSITLSMWYYSTDADGSNLNSGAVYSPDIQILDLNHWAKFHVTGTNFGGGAGQHDARGRWIFAAMTVDTTTATDNVKIYTGRKDAAVTLTETYSKSVGDLFAGFDGFYFGLAFGHPTGSVNNPFTGYMDEVRWWNDQQGAGGVLTQQQLEEVRQFDMVPEPMTMLLIATGGLFIRRK